MYRSRGNHRDRETFERFVEQLDVTAPRKLEAELVRRGYRGQTLGRRAVCLMAYRHVRRIQRIYRDQCDADALPARANYLLMGPTGCGKTHIARLLFDQILRIPAVIVDITAYSETGYVGQDPNAILTRLLNACNGNPLLAQVGVVCLDEFDKLASSGNNAVFAGAGTTKDVTGRGVQRELLKMLEGSDVEVPTELSHSSYSERCVLSTRDIAFVACGAFSGFKSALTPTGDGMGFGREQAASELETIASALRQEEVDRTANFQTYGFMPELIARFTRVVPFQPLDEDTLLRILDDNVIHGFVDEFRDEGIDLVIDEAAKRHVVTENLRLETGARGLSASLTRHIEDVAFEVFGQPGTRRVELTLGPHGIEARVDG